MIEQRRVAAKTLLDQAEQKRGEAVLALTEIEKTRAGFAREREAILATAQAEATQLRAASLEAVGKAASALENAASMRIEAERAAVETAWHQGAAQLAIEIAGKLAARLEGGTVRAAFLEGLLKEIAALPESMRRNVAAGEETLDVVSAAPLEAAEQQRYAQLIARAFVGSPKISFTADTALIAGMELRSKNFLLRNSWRADLDQIHEGIAHEQ